VAVETAKIDERVRMPSAIQIISKLRLMKLKIPPTGMNLCGYEIASGKKPGRPKSWAGNFAVVVPAEKICNGNNEGNFALRFFLAKTPSHITQITSFINNHPHPSLVGCKMYRSMLTMKDGEKVDMMEMDFVSGRTIDDWIKDVLAKGQQDMLSKLAEAIRESVNELVEIGFYHGDLSHSNIMIEDAQSGLGIKSRLKFIDYDSVLVSSVKNPPHTKETGHPNFQHPSRKASRFTMLEDVYFSSILIYVSLVALSASPKLWDKYHSKGDNIIFQNQKGDLRSTNTPLWQDLEKINFPGVTGKAFQCLKRAVENQQLVGSHFLSEIEEWFSTGSHNPTPTPQPIPKPDPNPQPNPDQGKNETQPSPKPRPRSGVRNPSPKPRPKIKVTRGAESPKIRKRSKEISSTLTGQASQSKGKALENSKMEKNEKSSIFDSVKNMLKKSGQVAETPKKDSTAPPKEKNEMTEILRPKVKESLSKTKAEPKKTSTKSKKKKSLEKSTIPVGLSDLRSKKVVIDGANILHEACTLSDFRMEPLMELILNLEKSDVESVHVVFDASTPHKLTKGSSKEEMYEMIDQNKDRFTLAPKATEADAIILNIAKKGDCIIITNDFYDDYKEKLPEEYDWFTKHHITASYAMNIWTLNTTTRNEFVKR
jgi:hypothetical protein